MDFILHLPILYNGLIMKIYDHANRKKYQTRIVSSARKTNLEFAEALPHLEQGLVNSIGGVF